MTRMVAARAALVLSAILVPALAAAEMPAARATLERLRLTPFGEGLAVHGTAYETPRPFHLDLLAHYQSGPTIGFDAAGEPFRDMVSDRLTFDLVGGFRADSWLEVGFRLPVILQDGDVGGVFPGESLASFGVGDPELSLRAQLFRPENAGLGVAVIAGGSFPATGGDSFIGERGGAFTPTVALTRPLGERVTLGLDLGAAFRDDDEHLDPLGGGDEFFASLGGVVRASENVTVIAELLSGTGMDDPFAEDGYGLEAVGAVRTKLGGGFHGIAGGGVGLIDAYGTPEFRVLGGIGWTMGESGSRRAEPEPLAVAEEPAPAAVEPKPEPKPEPAPAFERPAPRPAVTEAAPRAQPAPRREAPKAQPSFHAAVKRERLEIRFPNGGAELTPEARADLDALVARLGNQVSEIAWRVEGHSDNTGAIVPNRKLSRARAEAVNAYLRGKGMPEAWREDWYGPAFPKASNATAAGRAENRRADLTVVIE